MDAARWSRVQTVFHDVADRPADARRAALEQLCADDPSLIPEVEVLLAGDAASGTLMDRSIGTVAEELVERGPELSLDPAQFRPYRIKSLIGRGGMGTVYLAHREDLGNPVAIKILRDAWLSPDRRERFAAEQRMLARLTHPGIARLYDASTTADGTPWFVMEYVDGVPLTDFCRQTAAPIDTRVRLLAEVCSAVEYAHERGVIHRDLKPSNIMVGEDGSVRLLDFGIAKEVDGDAGRQRTTTAPLMTPAYAAPEQLRGEPATIRSDGYSLGVILYELLTDTLPFPLPRQVVSGDLSVPVTRPSQLARRNTQRQASSITETGWADLDVIVLAALHEEPDRRYPSVAALARDLRHYLAGEPLEARPDSTPYRAARFVRRRWRSLATAAVLFSGGALLARVVPQQTAPITPDRSVAVLPFRVATADSSLSYLGQALPEQLVTALSRVPGLVVRAASAAAQFTDSVPDLGEVSRVTRAAGLIAGDVRPVGDSLRLAMSLTLVPGPEPVWRDSVMAARGDLIELNIRMLDLIQGALSAALGTAPRPAERRPPNAEAYGLYLQSAGGRYDPGPANEAAIVRLRRALTLDPEYGPAWLTYSRRLYISVTYGEADATLGDSALAAAQRAVELDPGNPIAASRLAGAWVERGELGRAYRTAAAIVGRRPDNPDAHFYLSYVYRFAGLFEESADECAIALSIDPHNLGWRSCAVALIALGDYQGARGFLALDPGSEFARALTVHLLVRDGRPAEAVAAGAPDLPAWRSYPLLIACAAGRPAGEIAALAEAVEPAGDPETNYFAASHLSYCGRTDQALDFLRRAVAGHYCAYPLMDSDPLLDRLRRHPGFPELRAAAKLCHETFVAERGRNG